MASTKPRKSAKGRAGKNEGGTEKPLTARGARRLKQRQENPARAAEMHRLRLQWARENPAAPPRRARAARSLHVGCSGWFYWGWQDGVFYPPDHQSGGGGAGDRWPGLVAGLQEEIITL